MQTFNIHTHTKRCNHAIGEDEDYVVEAIKHGIKVLGFSDHVPFPNENVDEHRMKFHEKEAYLQSILKLKEKYKNQIDIKVGFECEYFEAYDTYYRELLEEVDYLILGQHLEESKTFDFCNRANDDDLLSYAKSVCAGIKTGYFTYLAHPEYFMLARKNFNEGCEKVIEEIAITCKEMNVPVEMNLKGISYGIKVYEDGEFFAYPHAKAIEIFCKYQNQGVFGLDVHEPSKFAEMSDYIQLFYQYYSDKIQIIDSLVLRNPVKGDCIIESKND
ncbi:MAG: histidinol-phosphatase [Erysipelotrichaceae bacterium]